MIPEKLQKGGFRFCLIKKKEKSPYEKGWTGESNYTYNDVKLQSHINSGGNYGVVAGYGDVYFIDVDKMDEELMKIINGFGETFTVMTGSGNRHYYYIGKDVNNMIMSKDDTHYGEIRASGQQVVGPGSTHPNGKEYKVIKDVPILELEKILLENKLYDYLQGNPKNTRNRTAELKEETDEICAQIKRTIPLSSIMSYYGMDTKKNPGKCPWHISTNACFSWNDTTGLWHCFDTDCMRGGNIFHLVMQMEACSFKVAKEKLQNFELLKPQNGHTTLDDVHRVYGKWLEIKDKKRIDIMLAVALTRKMTGTPIWLFIVGPSGDGKSEMVNAFENDENTVMLHEITPNTLVSGMSKAGELDLAPKLRDKLVIISDMAQLLNLHPNDKAKVWGQLRELYDGRAGKITGTSSAKYKDIRVTLMACSTPSIDSQILVFSHLGTRELIYRTSESDYGNVIRKVIENEKYEKAMKQELKEVTNSFLKNTDVVDAELTEENEKKIIDMLDYMRMMRASAEHDSYTGEIRNIVYPEQPTRVLKQLKRVFTALKSLDNDYPDEDALSVLLHIVNSSISTIRGNVLKFLYDDGGEHTTSQIAHSCFIGKKTAKRELHALWGMKLIDNRIDDMEQEWKDISYWRINSKGTDLLERFQTAGAVTK